MLTSVEICAGAGGQAIGLESAGFEHVCLIELDTDASNTLQNNRPNWNVINGDVKKFRGKEYYGVDLLAGGVPCPPFSVAGKQLGSIDERDLFPDAIRLIKTIRPKAIMIENVKGIFNPIFDEYRNSILSSLKKLGYKADWKILNASDFGVPQLRPRSVLVGFLNGGMEEFKWPTPFSNENLTVGNAIGDLMGQFGWKSVDQWIVKANRVAPTLVGGSKKHGGPDLGPTRAKKAWAELGVDGNGIANDAPEPNFVGLPKLTTRMAARLQGFDDNWQFVGKKTSSYRQVGNAFPPPVARAVGSQIAKVLLNG